MKQIYTSDIKYNLTLTFTSTVTHLVCQVQHWDQQLQWKHHLHTYYESLSSPNKGAYCKGVAWVEPRITSKVLVLPHSLVNLSTLYDGENIAKLSTLNYAKSFIQ